MSKNWRIATTLFIVFAILLMAYGYFGRKAQIENAKPQLIQYAKKLMDRPDTFELQRFVYTPIGRTGFFNLEMQFNGVDKDGRAFAKAIRARVGPQGYVLEFDKREL
jgi:hypothetical protein